MESRNNSSITNNRDSNENNMVQSKLGIAHKPPKYEKKTPIILRMENIIRNYDSHFALDNVTLNIHKGEIFALLGGSGAGKSTLLKIVAGFEAPSSGKVFLDGKDITQLPPYYRPINMMFQNYALFPHMSVKKNIAFGLKQEKLPSKQIKKRIEEMLTLVRMEKYADRKPAQLSGGQQQRVALARILAKQPRILLLDEPMGALDKQLRTQMRLEVVDILEEVSATCLMVTHDQEEAMTMADRIGIMDNGRIIQEGTPIDIYETPNSRITAKFIGTANIFEGNIEQQAADHVIIKCNELSTQIYIDHGITTSLESTKVWIAIRPEKIELSTQKPHMKYNLAEGVVEDIAYLGAHSVYHVKLSSGMVVYCNVVNRARSADRPTWNDKVFIYWEPSVCVVINS